MALKVIRVCKFCLVSCNVYAMKLHPCLRILYKVLPEPLVKASAYLRNEIKDSARFLLN